jgi:formate hydrogenlyase subunit 3/multisubunit Na+/H+ antiporter MnhD subunit
VTDPILPLLVCVACLLLALAGAETWGSAADNTRPRPRSGPATAPRSGRRLRHVCGLAAACLAGWAALLALIWLTLSPTPARLHLPLGPPGTDLVLALDALAGFGLVLVLLAGAAILAFAVELADARHPQTRLAGPLLMLAGCVLTLLAGNPVTLALALSTTAVGALTDQGTTAGRAELAGRVLAAGLAGAAALLLLPGGLPPPNPVAVDAWRAGLVILLALAGIGPLLGIVPFQHGFARMLSAASPATRAMAAGCAAPVAGLLLLRLVLAPRPEDPSFWWAPPLLLLGGLTAVFGAWRAVRETDTAPILAGLAQRQAGLLLVGLGLALIARSADLPDMAALALGAACLALTGQALSGTLAFLAGWGADHAAGTTRLHRLGGLWHRMPVTGAAMLIGLGGLIALPPGIGFATLWQMLQAILAAPRAGLASACVIALLLLALGLSAALALAATVRLLGMAFLGRPRLPRASAAEEIPRPARPVLLALAAVGLLVGLIPALVPALLARLAIRGLTEGAERANPSLLSLADAAGRGFHAPLLVAALVGLGIGIALYARRRPPAETRAVPPWSGGFAPPPPWLPFGDPLTQTDGTGFAPPVPTPRPPRGGSFHWRTLRARATTMLPWLILAPIAALLLILARSGP